MVQTTIQILERLVPIVENAGAKLVDVTVRGQRNRTVVEVFADTEQGITADELANISREIAGIMEAEQWFSDAYTLNVSSPGLERPIRFPWQYARHKNRDVEVERTVAGEKQTLAGTIHDVDDDQLVLKVGEGFVAIPHETIVQAHIQVKL